MNRFNSKGSFRRKVLVMILVSVCLAPFLLMAQGNILLTFSSTTNLDSVSIQNLSNESSQMVTNGSFEIILAAANVDTTVLSSLTEVNLSTYPNPFSLSANITFKASLSQAIDIVVHDISGKHIAILSARAEKGYNQFQFSPEAPGVYFLKLRSNSVSCTRKLICLEANSIKPIIEHVGSNTSIGSLTEPFTQVQEIKDSTEDVIGEFSVAVGDLLKFTGYSENQIDTYYDFLNTSKNYTFRFDRYFKIHNGSVQSRIPGLIDLVFAVSDSLNEGVDFLTSSDFIVNENNETDQSPQLFQHIRKSGEIPLRLKTVLLIDNSSGSIGLPTLKMGAKKLVKSLADNQEIAVYAYADSAVLMTDFTNNKLNLEYWIDRINTMTDKPSDLLKAIEKPLSTWEDRYYRSGVDQGALIVLSAEKSNGSVTGSLAEALEMRGDKRVYGITFHNGEDDPDLSNLASSGKYYSVEKEDEFDNAIETIQANIIHHATSVYALNYQSSQRGGEHSVLLDILDNSNTTHSSSVSGSYSAEGFVSTSAGVYLNATDTSIYGLDTIRCFVRRPDYYFTTDPNHGRYLSINQLELDPITYGGVKSPKYTLELSTNESFKIEPIDQEPFVLFPMSMSRDTATITLKDVANGFSKNIVCIMSLPGFTHQIEFVQIPQGNFIMGADIDPHYIVAGKEEGWRSIFLQDEFPTREIEITYDFEVSKYEITNLQYEQFDPDHEAARGSYRGISNQDNEAVVYVSWQDASDFAEWLTEQNETYAYRLPTEAEWEYVARAGTRTLYSNGDEAEPYENNPFLASEMQRMNYQWPYPYTWTNGCRSWTTWKTDNCVGVEDVYPDDEEILDVDLGIGGTIPNAFGVYNMHGGVEEWVQDWYGLYNPNVTVNPSGPISGGFKVARGGSHNDHIQHARSANRMGAAINDQHYLIGIRLVRIPKGAINEFEYNPAEVRPWGEDVSQEVYNWEEDLSHPVFEMTSLFELVPKLSDGSHYGSDEQLTQFGLDPVSKSALLTGPLYTHHHSPTMAWCKNGDILVSWFTGESEVGPELTLVASRGKRQSDGSLEWTYPSEFFKAADRNIHGSNMIISTDNSSSPGVLHQMASIGVTGRWDKMALGYRRSEDNGATWSPVRMILELDHGLTPGMVMQGNMLEGSNGDLIFVADDQSDGTSTTGSLVISSDEGATWHRRGHSSQTSGTERIAGLHAVVVEIADQNEDGKGDFLAIGRDMGNYYDGKAPFSQSLDGGHTWERRPSIFPSIKGVQRFGLLRLNYSAEVPEYAGIKPLIFVGFANEEVEAKTSELTLDKIKGLFVALSWDEGKTWPVEHRRVVSDVVGTETREIGVAPWQRTNNLSKNQGQEIGYMSVIQSPDGLIYLTDGKIVYIVNLAWVMKRK